MEDKGKKYLPPNVLVIFKNEEENILKNYKRYFSLIQSITEVKFTILETNGLNIDEIGINTDVKIGWRLYQKIINNIEQNKGKTEFSIKVNLDEFILNFRYNFILIIECDEEKELHIVSYADKATDDTLNISIINLDNVKQSIDYMERYKYR